MLLCCIILSSSGKTNTSSRHSKKDFWRRCRGGSRKQVNNTKYPSQSLSLALHYLPFASRFPLPHFTLAVLFALSCPISSSLSRLPFLVAFLFACVLDYLLPWRKIIPNCVISRIPIIMISLVLRLLLLMMLSLVNQYCFAESCYERSIRRPS